MRWGPSAIVVASLVACDSRSSGGNVGTLAASGSGGAGAQCNDILDGIAPIVDVTHFDGRPTASPQGGTIVEGTYFLTQHNVYGYPSNVERVANPLAITLVIRGGFIERLESNGSFAHRTTSTFTVDGSLIRGTLECQTTAGVSAFIGYFTATPTTLTMHDSQSGISWEYIFTRQ